MLEQVKNFLDKQKIKYHIFVDNNNIEVIDIHNVNIIEETDEHIYCVYDKETLNFLHVDFDELTDLLLSIKEYV